MKETGIIMSGSHPVDILEGRKTMTRRTRGLKEINECPDLWKWFGFDNSGRYSFRFKPGDRIVNIRCPYGQVGDRPWVRETWCPLTHTIGQNKALILYKSDGQREWVKCSEEEWDKAYYINKARPDTWRSSLFMPRWASRITLEITEVRVERLQEITVEDAEAEGTAINYRAPLMEFRRLWDSLNAKRGYGWDKNPWVWVIEFYRIKQGGDL